MSATPRKVCRLCDPGGYPIRKLIQMKINMNFNMIDMNGLWLQQFLLYKEDFVYSTLCQLSNKSLGEGRC